MRKERVRGWVRRAREADWRCWAMESAIRFKAEVWVVGEVVGWVDRVGRGGGGEGRGWDMVWGVGECEEGGRRDGGC